MKKVISAKDIEELIRRGGGLDSLPADAIITPAARDMINSIRGGEMPALRKPAAAGKVSALDNDFNSPGMMKLKEEICDIGRRLWQREYVDANGGNISIRVGENLVLCTPTLVSKGFMKPADLCLVDLDGNQKAGGKPRTSEVLMHLAIMKVQPKARAVVHCHPPYATAFAVCGIQPPTCMVPEFEVMVGLAPVAPYFTPGTAEMGAEVAKLADTHNTILMANHGVVAWGSGVEDAYFKMEVLEAYCRTIMVTAQLGVQPRTFSPAQLKDLLKIKQKLGIPDARAGLKECELCDNGEWRPGVTCAAPPEQPDVSTTDPDAEAVVRAVTDQLLARLGGK
ncbi:MAG: class II aldolase/adducin family protein [Verrucomicrobiae bacterium]|nr:class II aldolase/adducin family protein [Verrucomicrobiae bacterium]